MKNTLLALLALTTLASAQTTAIARLESTAHNRAHGTVWFIQQKDDRLRVVAHIIGLPANSSHGFHLHQVWKSAAIDLGALKADDFGVADLDVVLPGPKVAELMQRPVTLHAGDSEISANMAVGTVREADAKAMAEMPSQATFGGVKKP